MVKKRHAQICAEKVPAAATEVRGPSHEENIPGAKARSDLVCQGDWPYTWYKVASKLYF